MSIPGLRIRGALEAGFTLILLILMLSGCRQTVSRETPIVTYIQLKPLSGAPGTLITVSGAGWQSGETVVIYLVELESGATDGVIYAQATADARGEITARFSYPQTKPWDSRPSVMVESRGTESKRVAHAAFRVLGSALEPTSVPTSSTPLSTRVPTLPAPTSTSTVVSPTATPTLLPPTATPTPTRIPPTATPKPPRPTPTPTPVKITDWRGEYYNNRNLTGTPRVRNDVNIDFNWGPNSPMKGINPDNFSARWTRRLDFEGGTYRFHVRVDDGARLWVDGELLVDQWHDGSVRAYTADRTLTQGKHDIRLEMYEHTGAAVIKLWWEKLAAYPDWKGEYFNNIQLSGNPILTRNDKSINFNWGAGAPAPGLPADNFSVRWTRQLAFSAGNYRFSVQVDDGVRLWVDDRLLIDQWHDGFGDYFIDLYLSEGGHRLRLEMYERTGGAMIRLGWSLQTGFAEWKGEYFANRNLEGTPVLVRNDVNVDFNWGTGAPAPGLPADNFSVRWTRHIQFEEGTYRFCVQVDDGVSVEMDDKRPFIREWHDGSATYCADIHVTQGKHKVRVEYFEHLVDAFIHFWWQKIG
ncbi:MAG: PA14 domain-containing protein [Anaerolineae bacterium]